MKDKILLFIPGYNCEKQIIRVLDKVNKKDILKYFYEIIFVDNRSTDNTQNSVKDYLKDNKLNLKILENNENYNLGGSHKVAFNYAVQNKFNYVIVLHGDDQADINDIIPCLENKEYKKYDCLLGSRFMKGSKLIGYSKFRTFGNIVYNKIFSILLGKKITDLGSGLNMYSIKMLENKFYHKFPDKLTFNYCMIMANHFYKYSMKFFPITWREEDQKSNVKMVSQAFNVLKMLFKYRFNKKYITKELRDVEVKEYSYIEK